MAIKQLNPYLMFNGDAAKAIALYDSALGAKVQNMMRYGSQTAERFVAYLERRTPWDS